MGSECYVYETLNPIAVSDASSDPPLAYSVFRNNVTSSPLRLSDEIPAVDYFSLEVETQDAEEQAEEERSPALLTKHCENGQPISSESSWFQSGRRFKSSMLQLHKEIVDFCDFISPTPEEEASRKAAVERVFGVVKYIWPQCNVEVFGSFRTGLYLPTSDVDVVVLDSNVRTPQMGLNALARALSQKGIAKKIQVIAKTRVPIVKFIEKSSGIAFDVSFDVENGPKAADFMKDAVTKIPPLKPLCLVLKVFLQQRELNEVFLGGIGSYALLAMLIAQLQMHWRQQDLFGNQTPVDLNLGVLLVNFFDLYGRKLNIWDVGISCNAAGIFFLKSKRGFSNGERPYLISIEDPQTHENDIGKSSYNFFKVRSAFAMAYLSLTDDKTIKDLGPQRSILGTIIRPDPVLLLRKGGHSGELTFNSLLPGAEESTPLQFRDGDDTFYNWRLVDDDPLPRTESEGVSFSPLKKRKVSKSKRRLVQNEHTRTPNIEAKENGRGRDRQERHNDL